MSTQIQDHAFVTSAAHNCRGYRARKENSRRLKMKFYNNGECPNYSWFKVLLAPSLHVKSFYHGLKCNAPSWCKTSIFKKVRFQLYCHAGCPSSPGDSTLSILQSTSCHFYYFRFILHLGLRRITHI